MQDLDLCEGGLATVSDNVSAALHMDIAASDLQLLFHGPLLQIGWAHSPCCAPEAHWWQ